MAYLPPPKALFPQTPHHLLIHNLPCSRLLQEPPINFPCSNVLAIWAATVKHNVWPCSEATLKPTEMTKVFTTANTEWSAPRHRGKGSWFLHLVTLWVKLCLCMKLQLSPAKFKGDKCAPLKPDWYPQLGTDEGPEPRKVQNIHKSCWEQQVTQALDPLVGGTHPVFSQQVFETPGLWFRLGQRKSGLQIAS